jgi:hypothetical protein
MNASLDFWPAAAMHIFLPTQYLSLEGAFNA